MIGNNKSQITNKSQAPKKKFKTKLYIEFTSLTDQNT